MGIIVDFMLDRFESLLIISLVNVDCRGLLWVAEGPCKSLPTIFGKLVVIAERFVPLWVVSGPFWLFFLSLWLVLIVDQCGFFLCRLDLLCITVGCCGILCIAVGCVGMMGIVAVSSLF